MVSSGSQQRHMLFDCLFAMRVKALPHSSCALRHVAQPTLTAFLGWDMIVPMHAASWFEPFRPLGQVEVSIQNGRCDDS